MSTSWLIIILLGLTAVAYQFGRSRALSLAKKGEGIKQLHSRPVYYGVLTALWCGLPALFIFLAWQVSEPVIISFASARLAFT